MNTNNVQSRTVVLNGVEHAVCERIFGRDNVKDFLRADASAKLECGAIEQATDIHRKIFGPSWVTRQYLVPTANLTRFGAIFDHPPGPSADEAADDLHRSERFRSRVEYMQAWAALIPVSYIGAGLCLWKAPEIPQIGEPFHFSWWLMCAGICAIVGSVGTLYAARSCIRAAGHE